MKTGRTLTGGVLFAVLGIFLMTRAPAATSVTIDVMSWNLEHGIQGTQVQAQMDYVLNQAPRPQVLFAQEVSRSLKDQYLSRLLASDPNWKMYYFEHCSDFGSSGTPPAPPCNTPKDEGVAFFTTLSVASVDNTMLWGRDQWTDGRAAVRLTLDLGQGQSVSIFGSHLAAGQGDALDQLRLSQANALKQWAQSVAGPRLITGDFNADAPDKPAYQTMLSDYTDVWTQLRPSETGSSGFTFAVTTNPGDLSRRIDFWFLQNGANAQAQVINRPTSSGSALSDHYALTATFTVGSGGGTSPYPGPSPAAIPGTIQAENFDNGANGTAYFDQTAGNSGGQYRSTHVDIEATSGGGYNVGWWGAGEWLTYTVSASTSTNYTVSVRVAAMGSGGRFHIEVDNVDVTGPLDIPDTAGWQNWTTVAQRGVYMSNGQHVVKAVGDANGVSGGVGNLDWIKFDQGATTGAFQPIAIPGKVQGEEYDIGAFFDDTPTNQGGVYRREAVDLATTGDTGGGYVVGWWSANEWMNHTVDIASSGNYQLEARVASYGVGGTFRVEIDGQSVTSPALTIPNTNGWDTWTTVTQTVILPAGQHTLTIFGVTAGTPGGAVGNLNYLKFTHVS